VKFFGNTKNKTNAPLEEGAIISKMKLTFRTLATVTLVMIPLVFLSAKGAKNTPVMEDTEKGQILVLPDFLDATLQAEFPGYKIPAKTDFNPEMITYYYGRLIGVHPSVAWGDFNGDKKTDYALLMITGQTSWGPIVELVVFNGLSKKEFTPYRLGEVYNFKDDYVSFVEGKLVKGRFKKGAWFINWNKKNKTYDVTKS
jgi:hypothetical protein